MVKGGGGAVKRFEFHLGDENRRPRTQVVNVAGPRSPLQWAGMRPPDSELRRYPRIRSDVRVRAFVPPDTPATDSFGRGYDISEGGMGILLPMPLTPEQEVLVVFDVPPSRRRLGVRAIVRYALGNRYGVAFQPLLEPDLQLLRSALDELASIQGRRDVLF